MKILFICPDQSSRSVMAEGLARQMFGETFQIASASLTPGSVHPLAIETLAEIHIDISKIKAKTVTPDLLEGTTYLIFTSLQTGDLEANGAKRLVWPIPDPMDPPAGEAVLQARFRDTRIALSKHLKGLGNLLKI